MNIFKKLKKFFCKHKNAVLIRWYWTHGQAGMEPRYIEAEYWCEDCHKRFWRTFRGADANAFVEAHGERKQV